MTQEIKKVCQHKLGDLWKDGCCTDPPVENISQSNALTPSDLPKRGKEAPITSAAEESPTTQSQLPTPALRVQTGESWLAS